MPTLSAADCCARKGQVAAVAAVVGPLAIGPLGGGGRVEMTVRVVVDGVGEPAPGAHPETTATTIASPARTIFTISTVLIAAPGGGTTPGRGKPASRSERIRT